VLKTGHSSPLPQPPAVSRSCTTCNNLLFRCKDTFQWKLVDCGCPSGFVSFESCNIFGVVNAKGVKCGKVCAAGERQNGDACVKCPPGTYSSRGATECTKCPKYQLARASIRSGLQSKDECAGDFETSGFWVLGKWGRNGCGCCTWSRHLYPLFGA